MLENQKELAGFIYESFALQVPRARLYEGHYHDLLNDIGKEAVMADVKAWIDSHLPKA